jgi:hypothetical protein
MSGNICGRWRSQVSFSLIWDATSYRKAAGTRTSSYSCTCGWAQLAGADPDRTFAAVVLRHGELAITRRCRQSQDRRADRRNRFDFRYAELVTSEGSALASSVNAGAADGSVA